MAEISINEQLKGKKIEQDADRYSKIYRPQLDLLESSPLSKTRSITAFDYYALGKQLEQFDDYKRMCEEDGSVTQLGTIPNIAHDVIGVTYATSPLAVIASVQPVDEEQGTVYYKNVVAQSTRGNVSAGQSLLHATNVEQVNPQGFSGDTLVFSAGNTVAATLTYAFNLTEVPVKPGFCKLAIAGVTIPNLDDGAGNILGKGVSGSINYTTGAVSFTLTADPGNSHAITMQYATNFEIAADLPKIGMKLDSKSIRARTFALKDTIGLEQQYALRRRFGIIADDEMASDLIGAINSEIVNTIIVGLTVQAMGTTTWSKTAPSGVSYLEHKQTLKDSFTAAESVMLGNAGRGNIGVMIAGRDACSIIGTLPGFVKITDGSTPGPHIYGTLDGVTVVRVPAASVLDTWTILGLYNGPSPFESAAVYSPYMPLLVTTAMPNGINPLSNQKAAAVWAGVDVLVPQFVTKIVIS